MIRNNEIEEIIRLINKGINVRLLAFELEIPFEDLENYKKQLELRKLIKRLVDTGKIDEALGYLTEFVERAEYSIIEKLMLIKLKAYAEKRVVTEEELQVLENEKKKIGLTKNINEILEELGIQMPKRKLSNLKKKNKQEKEIEDVIYEDYAEDIENKEINYEEIIKKYKEEIKTNPQKALNTRNLLAFAYFKSNKIDEAREELLSLIEQNSSHTAYRQIVHLEKSQGNIEDAKLWAYDGLEKFPESIAIREQLITIAKQEDDNEEVIRQLKEIIEINPENGKNYKRLKIRIQER